MDRVSIHIYIHSYTVRSGLATNKPMRLNNDCRQERQSKRDGIRINGQKKLYVN